jgi:hypothetical protein
MVGESWRHHTTFPGSDAPRTHNWEKEPGELLYGPMSEVFQSLSVFLGDARLWMVSHSISTLQDHQIVPGTRKRSKF